VAVLALGYDHVDLDERRGKSSMEPAAKPIHYYREIYLPESTRDPWVSFRTTTPFMTIQRGDIINPSIWEGSQSPMKVLKAVNVEHIIWETDDHVGDKLMVFTDEVDGTAELRHPASS
jgi:hypothetical protein